MEDENGALQAMMRWFRTSARRSADERLACDCAAAAAIFFGSLGDQSALRAFLGQIDEANRKRVSRRVKALAKRTDTLLIADSGSASAEEHLDWIVERLRRRYAWIDDQVVRSLKHYCSWAAWHG